MAPSQQIMINNEALRGSILSICVALHPKVTSRSRAWMEGEERAMDGTRRHFKVLAACLPCTSPEGFRSSLIAIKKNQNA